MTVAGDSVEASNYDTVYDAAYDLIGHRNPSVSTFNLKDLIVDIDAVNIGGVQLLNNTEPLNQLIRNYYGYLGDYNWRFTKFLQSRFFMNNEEQSYDYLQDQATAILNSNDLLVAQARALFKDAFDVAYYTEEEGEEVARAFRDVIEREGAKE
ncbi:hypothetical protein [Gracilibacillus sp. JCM 18860]|uniref:hypothetical protein n=1 Tax=Gracilibacillus sp. JCM 18860 TaxID=1306159 RepID=UPI0006D196B8